MHEIHLAAVYLMILSLFVRDCNDIRAGLIEYTKLDII